MRFRDEEQHREWAEAGLRGLVVEVDEGGEHPRIDIIRASLAADNVLPSRLSAELGDVFNSLYPNAGAVFRDKVEELLSALLGGEAGSQEALAGWHLLRQASGDAPLPRDLAELAHERGKAWNLASEGDDLESARHHLLTFAALASVNGWADEGERFDAAALSLGPRDGDDEAMVLFEIAIWRARMISEIPERLKFLSRELLRLARHEPLRDQAIVAARHFARSLSGQQAEPFVDAMGELIATY